MKYIFKCSNDVLYKAISEMILENAESLANIKRTSINGLSYKYSTKDPKNKKIIYTIKVIRADLNEYIIFETSVSGKEKYAVHFELISKGKKTKLKYKTVLMTERTSWYFNHLILLNSVYYFSQRSKFKNMCNFLNQKINEIQKGEE